MIMARLFSIFDPSLSLFSFSWAIAFLVIFVLPGGFWAGGLFGSIVSLVLLRVKKEVDYVLSRPVKGSYLFVVSLFFCCWAL